MKLDSSKSLNKPKGMIDGEWAAHPANKSFKSVVFEAGDFGKLPASISSAIEKNAGIKIKAEEVAKALVDMLSGLQSATVRTDRGLVSVASPKETTALAPISGSLL